MGFGEKEEGVAGKGKRDKRKDSMREGGGGLNGVGSEIRLDNGEVLEEKEEEEEEEWE